MTRWVSYARMRSSSNPMARKLGEKGCERIRQEHLEWMKAARENYDPDDYYSDPREEHE